MHFLCFTSFSQWATKPRMDDKALIDKLGGILAVSEATSATKSAVSNWRLDGRGIPWKHKPAIARLAAERAVALPTDFWEAQKASAA